MYTSTPSVTGESWPNCFMLKLGKKLGINKTLLPTHLPRQQYAPPDAPPQAAKRRVVAERTTAEAKGRKRSFPSRRNPPRPPVDSSTRQGPEALSTLESSTRQALGLRQAPRPGPVTS